MQQINRNIELIRYKRYGDELILFELVNATTASASEDAALTLTESRSSSAVRYKSFTDYLADADTPLRDRYEALRAFLTSLGDDVQTKTLKYYAAFKRIKNFACVEIHPNSAKLVVFVKLDPAQVQLEHGFTRDVTHVGHYGTGDVEITIKSGNDLEKSKPLLVQSYEAS